MRKIINISLIAISLVLVMVLLLNTGAGSARSQSKKSPSGVDINLTREEIPHLIEIITIWKLVDELELKEEQLLEFLPKLREMDSLRKNYYRGRRKLINELEKLIEDDASEQLLKAAVDKFRNMDSEYYQKRDQLRDELYSNLTVEQQAKYVVFEDNYKRDMGDLIRKLRELSELREFNKKHQPVPLQQQKRN